MHKTLKLFIRRRKRLRHHLQQSNKGKRPRLCVLRSNQHIYAQIIDDSVCHTLVSASTLEKENTEGVKNGGNCAAAAWVGRRIAKKALEKGIRDIVFDRSGYLFHGRIQALASAARESGLSF
jgi:large subunit ribosomal protein L18